MLDIGALWRTNALARRVMVGAIVAVILAYGLDIGGVRELVTSLLYRKPATETDIIVYDQELQVRTDAPQGQSYVTVANRSGDRIRIEYRDLPNGATLGSFTGVSSSTVEKRIVLPPLDPGEDWDGEVPDLPGGRYVVLAVRVRTDGTLFVPAGATAEFFVERRADPSASPAPVITNTMSVEEHATPGAVMLSADRYVGHVDVLDINDTKETVRFGTVALPPGADPASFAGRAVHRTDLVAYTPEIAPGHRWRGYMLDGYFPPGDYVIVVGTVRGDDLVVPAGQYARFTLTR